MDTVGRYQLHEKLGEGGMGVVYKGYDPLIERVVAVKLIAGRLDEDPELRHRFFSEARAAGRLSHRNLVTIYDLGEEKGQPYFAMEFLEGRDLGRRMRSQEPMTLVRKLVIITQVGEGLSYAHAFGVTHRDIKPGNIFLTATGEVKLLDFGLAHLHGSDLTRSLAMVGTVSYMAPEQIRGERADARTDLFALGLVLYELLSGRRAFESGSFATTMHRILEEAPEPLGKLDPCLPSELIQIVDRTLAKAPEDRYQRVDDLLVDLAAFRATLRGSDPSCPPHEAKLQVQGSGSKALPLSPLPSTAGSNPVPPAPASGGVFARGRRVQWLAVAKLLLAVLVAAASWRVLVSSGGSYRGAGADRAPSPGVEAPKTPSAGTNLPATAALPPAVQGDRGTTSGTSGEAGAAGLVGTAAAPGAAPPSSGDPVPPARRTAAARTPPSTSSDDALRASAQAALVELARKKGRAEAANAQELAPASFEAAQAAEQTARARFDAGAYGRAAGGLTEAGHLFDRAESEARAEQARRAERQRELRDLVDASRRRYEEARRRAAEAGAETAAPGLVQDAAARAAEGQGFVAAGDLDRAARAFAAAASGLEDAIRRAAESAAHRAAPAPPERGPTEADRRAAAERAIADVIARYASALESRTMARLKRVWPSLSGGQERAIEEEFRNSRSIGVGLSPPRIELMGNRATATFERSYRLETRDGQRLQTDTTTVLTLHRDGDNWVIDEVRHQARQ